MLQDVNNVGQVYLAIIIEI